MMRMIKVGLLGLLMLLTGCQVIHTTTGGAVGVDRKQYMFSLLSTEQVNQMYAQSYQDTMHKLSSAGQLQNDSANGQRLQMIGRQLIAQAPAFRPDASNWPWEINLVKNEELNASCGPGGKIIFYSGIIDKLKLTDDEIAAVMGHEIAHALREHGREAMSKAYGVQVGSQIAALMGASQAALQLGNLGAEYLMTLPNSRNNETEADLIGLELAARAGYDPSAAITLWQKMAQSGGGKPPEFMSTHPSDSARITQLQASLPLVMPLYEQSKMARRD